MPNLLKSVTFSFAVLLHPLVSAHGQEVDFQRDVFPILESRCYECHAFGNREGGLRLDLRDDAFRGGDSGPVIVPGDPDSSKLYKLVSSFDPSIAMPAEGDPLTDEQVDLIHLWIEQGADWPVDDTAMPNVKPETPNTVEHWAFDPVTHPEPPEIENADSVRNDIDRFVLARLEREGIEPSPRADRETLIRRLHLDLLGLPPKPEDVDAFVNDDDPYAYEALVNRLLASSHFGERWGRHWLDLARYADSDGFEKDTVRPHAWRYRQWVIDAINRDLPYDQFVIDQLAGDLLPNPTLEQQVATGFHRNTLTNNEGGVDQEQFRVEQVVDRTNTTAAVFMGLTMACAQCHSHKYDPITQREYFGAYAFFNAGIEKDISAPLDAERALFDRELERYERRNAELERNYRRARRDLEERLPQWEEKLRADLAGVEWERLAPASMSSAGGATFTPLDDGSILVGGNSPLVDTYTIVVPFTETSLTGLRLEVLTDDSLPKTGPGRAHHGNFILSEITVNASPLTNPNEKKPVKIASGWAEYWEEGWPIEEAFDGETDNGWSVNAWQGYNENRTAVFVFEEDVAHPDGAVLTITLDHQYGTSHSIGRFRLYAARGNRDHLLIPPVIPFILATPADERTPEQKETLLDYIAGLDAGTREVKAVLEANREAKPELSITKAQTIARNPEPPETHVHIRGNFLQPGDRIEPHTPSVLPALEPRSESPDRLDLARWLVEPGHPLTARVAANRVWEKLFGQGLVLTSEDFGTRGELPSHPELLDWLATEYMKHGWSRKDLIRLIVNSATYRQSADVRPGLHERDPGNTLLARQNRFRVEAEIIRDLFLAASGLLNPTVGGPSVRPPLPPGTAELGYANSVKWPASEGDAKYRRGLYVLFQRTVPYPMLMTFDCPDSNVTAIRRARSNTPLQALTLMNDPVLFECAQALGKRAITEVAGDPGERVRFIFRQALGRKPAEAELAALCDLWDDQRASFESLPDEAAELAGAYLPEGADPREFAPAIIVARTVLNTDEFLTRE